MQVVQKPGIVILGFHGLVVWVDCRSMVKDGLRTYHSLLSDCHSGKQLQPLESSKLIHFLAPGLLHGRGNNLFLIQGNAQLLGNETAQLRSKILSSCEEAAVSLELCRCVLVGGSGPDRGRGAGVLLGRLLELLRVSLREHGLGLSWKEEVHQANLEVNAQQLCRTTIQAIWLLVENLPDGLEGQLQVGLDCKDPGHVELCLELVQDASQLPFGANLTVVVSKLQDELQAFGGAARQEGGRRLFLQLPKGQATQGATPNQATADERPEL